MLGVALLGRWCYYFLTDDVYHPRLPHLMAGVVLIVIAGQVMVIAFMADVVAANRRMIEDEAYARRRRDLEDAPG